MSRDKFMPEMHLKQPDFTWKAFGPFTKNKDGIQKLMQAGNAGYICENDIDKACFQHDMPYGKYKDFAKRIESDKVLKGFKAAGKTNYDGYQRGLVSIVYKFFNKKSAGSGVAILANKSMTNQLQLANELHKRNIRQFKRKRVYSSFKYNIWDADLPDMQLLSKYKKEIRYLLCAIYLFTKYVWVAPLKDKKVIATVQSILNSSKRKPNKIWVDQGSYFFNSPLKKMIKIKSHKNVSNILWRKVCSFWKIY